MKKNILISTGGSGGHVILATILYEHLKSEFNIFISSDERGIRFLDKEKYKVEIINVPKISKNIFFLPWEFFLLLCSLIKSFLFLKKHKIEILISTGGYMSVPLCFVSKLFNIKLFLIEPNMVLGRSNKLFLSLCTKIFCYSEKIKNFPNKFKNKKTIIFPLLRKEFYQNQKIEEWGKEVNLLIIGGSQGAILFDNIIESVVEINKKHPIKIYQQTNYNNHQKLKNYYLSNSIENELFDFNEDISKLMRKSNFCISRAGASTLAELIFLNIPHIAIPLLSSKDNHQFENALFYEQLGCNWIMNQNEISKDNLTNKLVRIIENKEDYFDKQKNMKNFNIQNTWNNINQKIIRTINEN